MGNIEDIKNRIHEAQENKTAPCSIPTCLGSCSECDYRAESWAEFLGCSVDDIFDATN